MNELRTLPQALAEAARADAGYLFVDGLSERRRSYADIHRASLARAASFQAMGLAHGDVVGLIVSDEEQFLTSLFGASIAGLIPAALAPPGTTTDLPRYREATANVLRSARARAVVVSSSLAELIEGVRAGCPRLAFVLSSDPADWLDESPSPGSIGLAASCDSVDGSAHGLLCDQPRADTPAPIDAIAFVQFTSGSTSRPKGVAITHRSLAANIAAINGPSGLDSSPTDSAVSWLPLYHDMGLVGMALGAMYCGRPAVLMTPATFVKRPVEWLRAISRHRATVSFAPNFGYDLCLRRVKEHDLDGIDLSCWRVAGCGAEAIHAATLAAFADKFRAAGFRATSFMASYGLAEHVLAATLAPRGRVIAIDARSGVDLVSCGSALPGHRIRIVANDGREAADGTTGEIALAGPSVMLGYFGDDEMTAEAIRDGWLYTGDLGYLADGALYVCGRSKDTVIVNGRKYHPQDLEWALDDLAGVRRGRIVAFGTAQAGLGDRVVMVVESNGTVPDDELTLAIRHRISDVFGLYVDDVAIVPGGTVARTTSGKVQRFAMRTRYEAGELARRLKGAAAPTCNLKAP